MHCKIYYSLQYAFDYYSILSIQLPVTTVALNKGLICVEKVTFN